jgi:CheY-like chemotaxis protein
VVATDNDAAYENGANSYLIKPNSLEELLKTIQNLGDFWFGDDVRQSLPPHAWDSPVD